MSWLKVVLPRDAVSWTIATAGEAILFSGLIVMIGFLGLLLIGVPIMISMGIGGAVVVGVAVLAALTLLPSLLGVLGPRINSLRIPFFNRFTMRNKQREASANMEKEPRGFWEVWAWGVMRRPVLIIVAVSCSAASLELANFLNFDWHRRCLLTAKGCGVSSGYRHLECSIP